VALTVEQQRAIALANARARAAGAGKTDPSMDRLRSTAAGLTGAVAGLADNALSSTPLLGWAAKTAYNVSHGRGPAASLMRPSAPVQTTMGEASAPISGYKPQTTGGQWLKTGAGMSLNAFLPGSAAQRAANVFLPWVGAEGTAQAIKAAGGNETAQDAGRLVGGVAGGGLASVRVPNLFAPRPAPTAVEILGTRTRQNPANMRTRADEMRAAGVNPTLADVVDDAGRGGIRAAANRQTPGRQVANDFSRNRTMDAPSRISGQSRRLMSPDPRTPDKIRTAMAARRATNANQAFGSVRGDVVQLSPEGVQALRTGYGRAAIAEAARRENDPNVRAALNRLANDALDNPSTPITVGMADRISRVLLGQAEAAGGDRDLASTLGNLGRAIREPAANASPGYRQALAGYGADSRLQQAAGVGEGLMQRNTDEFVAAANGLQPSERALALAAGRRAIERASGENPSTAAGVARRLADAPEQQARNAALMGPQRAGQFQNAMRAEAQAVENAQAIAPRSGSSTFLNAADEGNMRQAAGVAADIARGRFGSLGMRAYEAWQNRGLNDQQIEQLVRVATDPGQTDAAIAAITARLTPPQRQVFVEFRNAWRTGAMAALSAAGPASAGQGPQ